MAFESIDMRIDPSYGDEYRVAFAETNDERSAYYTDDLMDAYQTGVQMARASRRK
jgi:hypothetical protein